MRHNLGMGSRALLLLFSGLALLRGQFDPNAPLKPEVLLLARTRLAAKRTLDRLPNYTCTLTVERSQRRPAGRRFELIDTLRLEVALVNGKELYSWPGAREFGEQELLDMVGGGGAIGTGEFALHAKAVLLTNQSIITYSGLEEDGGKQRHRFNFAVPQAASSYILRVAPLEGPVGYTGSFWVDPESYELHRLEMDLNDIAPHLPVRGGRQSIEYARQKIGAGEFLLPVAAEVSFVMDNGLENRNRSSFADCHQFSGESTLSFEEIPDTGPAPPSTIAWTLPPKLRFDLRPVSDINLAKAAKGDLLRFRVTRDAKSDGQVWLPKDAAVQARLLAVLCVDTPRTACALSLQPESFRFENKQGTLHAALEAPLVEQVLRTTVGGRNAYWPVLERLRDQPPGASLLFLMGSSLSSGYSSTWRTLESRE